MNDLISRSALLDYCDAKAFNALELWDGGRTREAWLEAFEAVRTAPTIDAVKVVRCKDCRRWGTGYGGETEKVKVCYYAGYMVGENGYCVYGERKMDGE